MKLNMLIALMETNRLVSELMAGNLSKAAVARIRGVADAENLRPNGSMFIKGKRYGAKRMLRDPKIMVAGMARGNEALMKKHNLQDVDMDTGTLGAKMLKKHATPYAGMVGAEHKTASLKARDTMIPGSPQRKQLDAVNKELLAGKAGYVVHSDKNLIKLSKSKDILPLVKRHEIHEFEAGKNNPNAASGGAKWRSGEKGVAAGHAHPEVLAKEMNEGRRLVVHGADMGRWDSLRKSTGEVAGIKSVTGKTYGKQSLTNQDMKKVKKMKPTMATGKPVWNLQGRNDKIKTAMDTVAKAQPEFKQGEAAFKDWTTRMQMKHGNIKGIRMAGMQSTSESRSGGVTNIFETLGRSVTKAILVESRR